MEGEESARLEKFLQTLHDSGGGGGGGQTAEGMLGFYSDVHWVGPTVDVGAWRDDNYHHLGDEYLDRDVKGLDPVSIAKALQISPTIAEELTVVCNTRALTCPAQQRFVASNMQFAEKVRCIDNVVRHNDVSLNTLRMRRLRFTKGVDLSFTDYTGCRLYRNVSRRTDVAEATADDAEPRTPVTEPEAVLTVTLIKVSKTHPGVFRARVAREYEVLSRQSLDVLKDVISCSKSNEKVGEFSDDLGAVKDAPSFQDLYPSAFFFIEGVFYDDLRGAGAQRLSDHVVAWSRERDRGWGGVRQSATDMSGTRLEELQVQLGKPYLLLHLGDCEHVLMVSAIRLYHPDDSACYEEYPRETATGLFRRKQCAACQELTADWLVVEDDLLPCSPAFLCNRCVRQFHYDHKGNKVGHFKALHFIDWNAT